MPNEMEYLSVGGTSYEVADGCVRQELEKKIGKPSNAPQVGKTLKVLSVNEDGTFTCEWADAVTAENIQSALGYTPVKDVQVAGSSVLADGVANVPMATAGGYGAIKFGNPQSTGIWFENGIPFVSYATDAEISGRMEQRKTIVCANLDYAVKAAMCDGKGAAWTADEQKAARIRMGTDGGWQLIEEITVGDDTTLIERSTTLDGTPYDFRQVFIRVGWDRDTNAIGVNTKGLRISCNNENVNRANNIGAYIAGDCTEAEALITYDEFLSIRAVGRKFYYNGYSQMEEHSAGFSDKKIEKIIIGHYAGITPGIVIKIWGRK